MKKLLFPVILFCLFALYGCGSKGGETDVPPFNPYVEAFTSGTILRTTPVYLVFNQEIALDKMLQEKLKKQVRIKPDVKGAFSFENNRTIVFKPEKEFERDTKYTITANIDAWFDVKGDEAAFSFHFGTYPLAIRANFESADINEKNENGYDFRCTVFTPDKESATLIESLVAFSEKGDVVWEHNPDGKSHEAKLMNISPATEPNKKITLAVVPNKQGVPAGDLVQFLVPQQNDFSVYAVNYISEPERYVEVTFTRLLDDLQQMQGLAFIKDNTSETVTIDRDKLRLYPDAQRTGTLNIHLNKGIRSKSGLSLAEDVVQQVTVESRLPEVRFVGNGVIIPQSENLRIPFQAVHLRGVVVRVIKILEQNIGQFLQVNNLDGTSDLMRVGRLVARKTIFMNQDAGKDLSQWGTYALDLRQLMTPESGAIYRVELSFNKQLSAYPCEDSGEKLSEAQLLAQDVVKFNEEKAQFDAGGYYYYNDGFDWNKYDYDKRDDPCSESFYIGSKSMVGKNVLATNLGIMALAGENNGMTVLVHNLLTTNAEQGVKVAVYNYQNQLLGEGITDNKGQVQFPLTKGKPFYVIASLGAQRSYLRVDPGSSLSLSSFDVSGEVVQKGIKGFIYGDRGVWRPGDTLHLGFMLNDREKKLPANHPVVMELLNPLGQLYLRKTLTRGELGLYAFDMPTEPDAPTGAWGAKVLVGGVSFTKRLRVEAIKPNRLKINLTLPEKVLLKGEPLNARLFVQWLQGATARNLKYEIEGTFVSTPTTFAGFNGYCFDDPSKTFSSEESKLISGQTNAEGNATIDARFELGSTAPGMLMANLVTRVFEESGDFSVDGSRVLYSPYRRYAGIKAPQQDNSQLQTDKEYSYQVASSNYLGKAQANVPLQVEVYKVNWYWWWSSDDSNLARYISDSYNKPVQRFTATTNATGIASFDLSFSRSDWGTYFIRVTDSESKHSSGIMSYFDWPDSEGRRNESGGASANTLSFKTDKDNYTPGEKMTLTFPSSKGSCAIISLENGNRVLSITEQACTDTETTVKLDITSEMQPNAYVYITLLQPHGITENDLPIRMYGVVPFTVTSPESHLTPLIQTPAEIKPEGAYQISVSEKTGREMAYTLAIVDEGLLDLTHFKTPDPWKVFNAREALGVSTWDLYNYVVGAYGGRIEQLFSIGGDDALNKGPKAIVNRFKPVVQFDGPFLLKKGQTQQHSYTMPNYSGRVRVMVVAGNGEAYGQAEKSVPVRKPVMLLGTLPRVIGVGEEMVVPATVFATEAGVGKVTVSIKCSANMEIMGAASRELNFTEKDDKQALFRIRVKDKPGAGRVVLTATGKGEKSVYQTDIEIRSVRTSQVKVLPVTLEAGKSWKEKLTLPGVDGTNKLTLEVADVEPLNLTSRLSYLLGYPHGCLEQITSKAFPQLYLSQFASLSAAQEKSVEAVVKETIRRLRSYQTAEGAFSYWPGGTDTNAWGSIYAAQFLCEAQARGYMVPEAMKRNLLNNLRLVARNWKAVSSSDYYYNSDELTQAYRLYVLALAGTPEIGAMNRLKENKQLGAVGRWMLAGTYAKVGRKDVALQLAAVTVNSTNSSNGYELTFGSDLRNKAIALQTLCLLDKGQEAAVLARELSKAVSSNEWMSTQTTAFALVSLSEYMHKYKPSGSMSFTYLCAGKTENIATQKHIWTKQLLDKAATSATMELKNTGSSTLFAGIIMEGIPAQGDEQAYANGIALTVSYQNKGGQPVNVADLPQGTNFVAVVTVKNPTATEYNNLVLSQLFPAGWEILTTRFMNEQGGADRTPSGISYQDIRDDRVYSYIDQLLSGRQVTVKVNLCAVYPGRFYLPPVNCEAMYNRLIRANTEGVQVVVQ